MNPVNAYDIQQSAVAIAKKDIEKQLNSEALLKIKDVAYKNGILVEDIMLMFGIFLMRSCLKEKRYIYFRSRQTCSEFIIKSKDKGNKHNVVMCIFQSSICVISNGFTYCFFKYAHCDKRHFKD